VVLCDMTYDQLLELCDDSNVVPESSSLPSDPLLLALWHDRRGHWDIAHEIAQSVVSEQGSALHAYLHREEGDESNALYWYRRARRTMPTGSIEDEWAALSREFCSET